MLAHTASWLTPTKVNVIFLKVQTSATFPDAYDAISEADLALDESTKNGLDGNVAQVAARKLKLWDTISGGDIKDQISLDVEEVGHLRMFYIVWEPDRTKKPRTDGFRELTAANFKAQVAGSQRSDYMDYG